MFTSAHFASSHFASSHFTDFGEGLFIFEINGINGQEYLQPGSLDIQRHMNNRSTANFTMVGIGGYAPQIGEEVFFESSPCVGVPFKRIFAGHVKDVKSGNDFTGRTVFHDVTCVDYNALLDKRLVFNIYEKQPVQDVVLAIVEDFLKGEGITTNNVDCKGLLIEKVVFPYVKASKAFNDISTNTGLFWYIDFYKDLHFFLRSTLGLGSFLYPAPVTSQYCLYFQSKAGLCSQGIKNANIVVDKRSDQVVNNQFVIAGHEETRELVESFVGDGTRKTFTLKYPISTLRLNPDKTFASDAVTVNGLDESVGLRDEEEVVVHWRYAKGENTITQDDSFTELGGGDTLVVTYKGLFPVVRSSSNAPSISSFKRIENTSGIYMDVLDDESIESGDYAQKYADGLVRKFSKLPIIIKFSTDMQVLDIGEIISVRLDDHKINLNNGFIVNSISIKDVDGIIKRFVYELISGENLGDWQEYYRKIEFFGRRLRLREQEKLIINEDLPEENAITQTFSSALGIATLETQDIIYDRVWMNIGDGISARNLHLHNMHSKSQSVILGLV
jgi:hypothetical protein